MLRPGQQKTMHDFFTKAGARVQPEYFFWAAVLCALFLILQAPVPHTPDEAAAVALASEPPKEDAYKDVELKAKAAYVYDVQTEQPLFSKNALEELPLASITKVMTAATALSLIPDTTYISITDEAIRAEGNSGFYVGERWLLRDLLKFTLLQSSNDGAVAVSDTVGGVLATSTASHEENRAVFVRKMNEMAESIGLRSTRFVNETGLDIDEKNAGAYSTAAETARMFAFALKTFPSVFTETRWSELTLKSEKGEVHSVENTNKGTNQLPLLLASKTGYTDLAGGNLVIAFDASFGQPVVVVVLGSTEKDRFSDVEQLVWATLASFAQR